jgi:hypothetical protein
MPIDEALRAAARFAQAHESPWPRDPVAPLAPGAVPWGVHHGDPPPFDRLRGPVHARGPQSGVVWRRGEEVAAWGEPARADLTFSVAKSYLALLAGVAQRDGLLPDEDARVADRLPGIGLDSAHNRAITWTQLLTQTSEWEGTCFGVPTFRPLAQGRARPAPAGRPEGGARPPQALGTYQIQRRASTSRRAAAAPVREASPKVFLDEVLRRSAAAKASPGRHDDAWIELPRVGRAIGAGGSHRGGGV